MTCSLAFVTLARAAFIALVAGVALLIWANLTWRI